MVYQSKRTGLSPATRITNQIIERLEAGTIVHLPPGHPHAVRAGAGPFSMLLTLGAEPANALATE